MQTLYQSCVLVLVCARVVAAESVFEKSPDREIIFGCAGFVGLMFSIAIYYWCRHKSNSKTYTQEMLHNPYPREYDIENAGGKTLARNLNVKASPALAEFMRENPQQVEDDDSDNEEVDMEHGGGSSSGGAYLSSSSAAPSQPKYTAPAGGIKGFNKRVSTRATGQDYGMLDASAKARIASIRMDPSMMPFKAAPPPKANSKALKMLGVDEESIAKPFDEDIQTRMARLAQKAGGGQYAPGLATAKLGNQIVDGFKDKRAKQLEKARLRKERELAQGKPKPPKPSSEKREEKPKEEPGANKLNAFLKK